MRTRSTGLVALAITISHTLDAKALPRQFDLHCSGERTIRSSTGVKPAKEPISVVYHVDLANKVWCESTCTATQRLQLRGNQLVYLETLWAARKSDAVVGIELSTLAFTGVDQRLLPYYPNNAPPSTQVLTITSSGACEATAFTGMPIN